MAVRVFFLNCCSHIGSCNNGQKGTKNTELHVAYKATCTYFFLGAWEKLRGKVKKTMTRIRNQTYCDVIFVQCI